MLSFGFKGGKACFALFARVLRGGAAGVVGGDGGDVGGVDVEGGGWVVVGVLDLGEGGGASGGWCKLVEGLLKWRGCGGAS